MPKVHKVTDSLVFVDHFFCTYLYSAKYKLSLIPY